MLKFGRLSDVFTRICAVQSRLMSTGNEYFIPPYVEKSNESEEVKRSRLQYQSRKRGMLENCILLSTFSAKHLSLFNKSQLEMYDRLINLPSNDWEIYYWATGVKKTPDEFDNEMMDLLKSHVRNNEKELRGIVPPLIGPT